MANLEYWDETAVHQIWQIILGATGNAYGTAGIMGNLYAESGICPFRCEGLSITESRTRTDTVIKGLTAEQFANYYTTEYMYDGKLYKGYGYSLAQWTPKGRKIQYYNFCGQQNLGGLVKSTQFLIEDVKTRYPAVWNAVVNATDIRTPCTSFLRYYEVPRDWQGQIDYRASLANKIYKDFAGLPPPVPPEPPTPGPGGSESGKLPIYLKCFKIIIK